MAKNSIATSYDDAGFPASAATVASLSASAGVQVVKAGPGRLLRVIVTTATATTACTVYDINLPAVNGITVNGAASAGQLAIGYA